MYKRAIGILVLDNCFVNQYQLIKNSQLVISIKGPIKVDPKKAFFVFEMIFFVFKTTSFGNLLNQISGRVRTQVFKHRVLKLGFQTSVFKQCNS